MKKIRIISCLTTIGIMVLIFSFSSQNSEDSSAISRGFTERMVDFVTLLFGETVVDKKHVIEILHGSIRKAAHFTIYAVLGVSSFVMFKAWVKRNKLITSAAAVVFCLLYAVSDEVHQLSISGRSGEIRDILIDTAGAVTGIMLLIGFTTLIKRKIKRKNGK